MIFQNKVMFLGCQNKSFNGENYTIVKVLDKETNEPYNFYTKNPIKFKDCRLYTDVLLDFELVKRYNKDTKVYEYKLYLSEG